MSQFNYREGKMHCEQVALDEIAAEVGTPFYAYSRKMLTDHYTAFDQGFASAPHIVAYAVKANGSLGVVATLARLGAGADVVSAGELYRALKAGVDPQRIVYSGVGKTAEEMAYALRAGILMFNVESVEELEALNNVAAEVGKPAPVALRINPDVDPKTHKYISTGLKENKFGIDIAIAEQAYARAGELPNIRVIGLDCHIGSQLTQLGPVQDAVTRMANLIVALRADGHAIEFLDVGGGLGIVYSREHPPAPTEYAQVVLDAVKDLGVTLIMEPGRFIAGNAGALVTKVLYRKTNGEKRFIIIDAAMNDLLRPSLYDSFHEIKPVAEHSESGPPADIVGPICETGDFLARNREFPEVDQGELLAVLSAGAYGFSMASTYNARPKCAEVLVDGDKFHVIRRRETFEDLIEHETIPTGVV
ncbi:MAG: diaminopimelate decarboxylase [Deltaproteobacteria bacterium]|nr:diaminopimelate decarboxylase [Deltaproteobacteria bacterium]